MKKLATLHQLTLYTNRKKESTDGLLSERSPDKSVVQSLLNYSKSLSIKSSSTIEKFEIVLS